MKYKIVLVPFPFDDLSGAKPRPTLCLTNKIGVYNHIIIAQISSQIGKAGEPSDLLLTTEDANFRLTGLKVDSVVRLHRLITIPVSIIRNQLGSLPSTLQVQVELKLKSLFEI